MPLQPSRRDNSKNPARGVRHHESYLRGLDPGFLGGRFATPQPIPGGPSPLVGGDEGGGDEDVVYEWEWGDRLVVTSAGQQAFRLSHLPVEESLVIRWHPDGKGALTQINERYILQDQIVTILDPDGDIEPGDLFSAQYQFDPGVMAADEPLTLVGAGTIFADSPTIDLPIGSQVGDFIVLTSTRGTTADSRLALLASHTDFADHLMSIYAGTLSNLGSIAMTAAETHATWAVFRAPSPSVISAAIAGPGGPPGTDPVPVPQVSAEHAIFACIVFKGVTEATVDNPAGYTEAGYGDITHFRQRVSYWDGPDASTSPAGVMDGGFDDYLAIAIGVTNIDGGSEE